MRRTQPTTDAPRAPNVFDWHAIFAVIGVALAASLAGLQNQFANDDILLIEANQRIQDIGNWKAMFSLPYWPPPYSPDVYRPLMSLLHSAEFFVGFGSPLAFRVTSYLLYAAVSVAVFLLLSRWTSRGIALALALVFAAHPVHVEAVALGVAQNEIIVALLAIVAMTRYLDRRAHGPLSRRDWLVLGALFVAASLFKEEGFVIPGLLLSVEVLLGDRATRPTRSLAMGFGFLAALGMTVLLVRAMVLHGIAGTSIAPALFGLSIPNRALTMLGVVPQWLRLLAWPFHLRADYSPQEFGASTSFGLAEATGLLILLAMLAAVVGCRRRAPLISFGLCWIASSLFPVSNVVIPTGILIAERTLFLPSVGFVILAGGIATLVAPIFRRRPVWLSWAQVASVTLVTVGLARSAERQRVWRNEGFLTVRTAQDAPQSFKAQRDYGNTLFQIDQPAMAIEAFRHAIALAPPDEEWRIRDELARHYRETGQVAAEVGQLLASLAEKPTQDATRGHLVAAYLRLGKYHLAELEADTAIRQGGALPVYHALEALADSALRAGAPPGTIVIDVATDQTTLAAFR